MKPPLVFVLMLILGIVIAGVALLRGEMVILAIPLIVYVCAAVLQRPAEVRLWVRREITPEYASQGTPITVRLTLVNEGPEIDELAVHDTLPPGVHHLDGEMSEVTFLEAQGRIELEYTVEAQRGAYDSYEARIAARDFLGFFEHAQWYRTPARLVVHPRYPKLDRVRIRPPQTRGFAGPIAARQGGSGLDFWGIREYQSGDPQRQINWKRGTHLDYELYTNIFEQERVADVGVIVDARQRVNIGTPSDSLFEHAVRAAAALAEIFLDDGNRVSLLIYGSGMNRVYPGYGRVQRDRILKALSGANVGVNYALENLAGLPTRLFPAKSQIVLVSPLAPDDIPVIVRMRARGYAVMVISPDPVSFQASMVGDFSSPAYRLAYAERAFMLLQIRRSGVQVVNWQTDQPFEVVVRNRLSRQSGPFVSRAGR